MAMITAADWPTSPGVVVLGWKTRSEPFGSADWQARYRQPADRRGLIKLQAKNLRDQHHLLRSQHPDEATDCTLLLVEAKWCTSEHLSEQDLLRSRKGRGSCKQPNKISPLSCTLCLPRTKNGKRLQQNFTFQPRRTEEEPPWLRNPFSWRRRRRRCWVEYKFQPTAHASVKLVAQGGVRASSEFVQTSSSPGWGLACAEFIPQ